MTGRAGASIEYVGRYRELPHGPDDAPSLHSAVALPSMVKERVVRHLRSAPVVAAAGAVATDVVSGDHIGVVQIRTDGYWVWYDDLAHYVEIYDSPIPDEFVEVASAGPEVQLTQDELMHVARETRGF